jgi:ATP-dependent DNA ligase
MALGAAAAIAFWRVLEQRRIVAAAVASYSALPERMLARSGRLPTRDDYAYQVKWDGFRAIVSTEGPLRVRSRRGWAMTPQVGFVEGTNVAGLRNEAPRDPRRAEHQRSRE